MEIVLLRGYGVGLFIHGLLVLVVSHMSAAF